MIFWVCLVGMLAIAAICAWSLGAGFVLIAWSCVMLFLFVVAMRDGLIAKADEICEEIVGGSDIF